MVRELDLVGEISHEEYSASAVFLYILFGSGVWQVIGVETVALILYGDLYSVVIYEVMDGNFLFRREFISMNYGVVDALNDRQHVFTIDFIVDS